MCNKGIKKTRQIHVKGTIWLACSRWNGGGEDSVDRLLLPQEKISTFSIDIFPHSQNNFCDNQRNAFQCYGIHTYTSSVAFPKQSLWWSIRSKLWKASAQCEMAVTCFETWYYFFSLTNHCNRLFHLILDWRVSTCFITNLAGYLIDNFLSFRNGTLWKFFGAFSFEKFENILTVWNFDGFMSSWQNSPWGTLQVANGSEGHIIDRTRLKSFLGEDVAESRVFEKNAPARKFINIPKIGGELQNLKNYLYFERLSVALFAFKG